jgi:hypothetical protein
MQVKEKKKEIKKTSKTINNLEYVMNFLAKEWSLLSEFHSETYPLYHLNVEIPMKCSGLIQDGKMLSDKQSKIAFKIRDKAYAEGFEFAG